MNRDEQVGVFAASDGDAPVERNEHIVVAGQLDAHLPAAPQFGGGGAGDGEDYGLFVSARAVATDRNRPGILAAMAGVEDDERAHAVFWAGRRQGRSAPRQNLVAEVEVGDQPGGGGHWLGAPRDGGGERAAVGGDQPQHERVRVDRGGGERHRAGKIDHQPCRPRGERPDPRRADIPRSLRAPTGRIDPANVDHQARRAVEAEGRHGGDRAVERDRHHRVVDGDARHPCCGGRRGDKEQDGEPAHYAGIADPPQTRHCPRPHPVLILSMAGLCDARVPSPRAPSAVRTS